MTDRCEDTVACLSRSGTPQDAIRGLNEPNTLLHERPSAALVRVYPEETDHAIESERPEQRPAGENH